MRACSHNGNHLDDEGMNDLIDALHSRRSNPTLGRMGNDRTQGDPTASEGLRTTKRDRRVYQTRAARLGGPREGREVLEE